MPLQFAQYQMYIRLFSTHYTVTAQIPICMFAREIQNQIFTNKKKNK